MWRHRLLLSPVNGSTLKADSIRADGAPCSEPWKQILSGPTAHRAVSMACTVAERLRDPMDVERAASIAYARTTLAIKLGWHPATVAMGYAGLALLFGQLERCRPDEGWDLRAHNCLELAAYECDDLGLGLFGGITGVAMVAWNLSRNGERYSELLSTLDRALLQGVPTLVARVNAESSGMPFTEFDVVSGLTGIAAYLLVRADQPEYREHLATVLDALLRLWEEIDGRPRWHTPFKFVGLDAENRRQFPYGNLNCGLAHGIPGPLAILSLASLAGITEPTTHQIIYAMADWLVTNRIDDAWGLNWTNGIGLTPIEGHFERPRFGLEKAVAPTHNAWCYGSAGVAVSLRLASKALGDDRYAAVARDALRAIMRRPKRERGIESPTFCHGLAGLLQVFTRFAQADDGHEFVPAIERIFSEIEEAFEPGSLFGFRSMERYGRRIDQPGLLDGAPGVALALLAAGTATSPDWDRIFLLS